MELTLEYVSDYDVQTLEEETWYYSSYDGFFFVVLKKGEAAVTIARENGEVETWTREETVFNDEEVHASIHPVKFENIDARFDS